MPTYPFECEKCQEIEEILCPIAERDKYKICPKCGGERQQIICSPKMIIIHDCQGKADLYHKRVISQNRPPVNTTDGINSRYYFRNNPSESPNLIKRKMENDAKKVKDGNS